MSDMKCPFCQQELKHEKTTGIYCCPRTFIDCPLGLGTGAFGTKELWQELIRTRKELEQSETCCTEWEKQALDYKANNIALSGELDRTRKALEIAVDALDAGRTLARIAGFEMLATGMDEAVNKITALEQKQPTFVHNKIEFPEYNDNLLEEFDKQFFENGQDDDLTETALEQKDK